MFERKNSLFKLQSDETDENPRIWEERNEGMGSEKTRRNVPREEMVEGSRPGVAFGEEGGGAEEVVERRRDRRMLISEKAGQED